MGKLVMIEFMGFSATMRRAVAECVRVKMKFLPYMEYTEMLTFPAQFFPAGLLTGRCGVPGKLHCQAEGQSLKAQYRFLGSFE